MQGDGDNWNWLGIAKKKLLYNVYWCWWGQSIKDICNTEPGGTGAEVIFFFSQWMNYYEIHVCLRVNLANVQGLHESLKLMQLDHILSKIFQSLTKGHKLVTVVRDDSRPK